VYALFVIGFSFYALHAAVFLAMAGWLASVPLLYRHTRQRRPHSTQHTSPFLAGVMAIVPFLVAVQL
jgi:hypothetical protein